MSDLVELTLVEASALVRTGDVSASELVAALIRQIEATEPVVHAYSLVLAEKARTEAAEADKSRAGAEWRGPLHGIPVAVKDVFYTADAITKAGSDVLAGFQPTYDATAVKRLREAGAIVIGKTTCQELAYGQGALPTRNPWNSSRSPGGSSAGSAVAVASRSAFAALGTDTGGSVRIPAALNGVVGLKPTFGRVSRRGVVPLSSSLDHVGPIARTVPDCALLLNVIAGFDPLDRTSANVPVSDYLAALEGNKPVTLGIDYTYFFSDLVTAEVRRSVELALRRLEEGGARVVEVAIPDLDLVMPAALTILLADASAYHHETMGSRGSDYGSGTRAMLHLGELLTARQYVTAQRVRRHLEDAVKTTFTNQRLDALIAPTLPSTAGTADERQGDFEAMSPQSVIGTYLKHSLPASLLGLPAISIPCGFAPDGLPVGLQFIGRPFEEATLFRAAYAYEAATRWHERWPEAVERPAQTDSLS